MGKLYLFTFTVTSMRCFLCVQFNAVSAQPTVDANCREFAERYEVQMSLDNERQQVKVDVEFLPANHLAKNTVKLTVKSVGCR